MSRHYLETFENTGSEVYPYATTWRCHCGIENRCIDEQTALDEWHNHPSPPVGAGSSGTEQQT